MAHKITYYGDAQIAADVVLEFFAKDDHAGAWYVQIEKHDGSKVEGNVTGYEVRDNGGWVTLTEHDETTFAAKVDGETMTFSTDDIYHLEVP